MPKKNPEEKEERCLRLWLLAHRAYPEWSIEKVYLDILCEEFERRVHKFRKLPGEPWTVKQRRSLSWFTQRIAGKWKGLELPVVPKETIVKPWDENWGEDPARIHILSVLFDLATDICRREDLKNAGFQFQFNGFPISVCNWACKLCEFFDLQLQFECLALLHFAYVFAADEQYATEFEETMSFEYEGFKMLMQWNKRNQEPLVTGDTSVEQDRVLLPIWERSNRDDMIWAVALHLTEGPWVRPSIIVHDPSIEIANQEQEAMLSQEENV